MRWKDGSLEEARVLSRVGNMCRVRSGMALQVTSQGRPIAVSRPYKGVVEFKTAPGVAYTLTAGG